MSESKDVKIEETGDGEKEAITMESLAKTMETNKASQDEIISALKDDNTNNVNRLEQVIRGRDSDIQNLTNLLGNLGKPEEPEDEDVEITPGKVKDIVKDAIATTKQAEVDEAKQVDDAYWSDYAEDVQNLQNKIGPDGNPLSKEARAGIMELLKTTVMTRTDNSVRDAYDNHKEATNIYFGLGKKKQQHEFAGGDVGGTGSGGTGFSKGTKKTRTFSAEQKEEFKELGVTEEWASKVMDKKEQEAVA